MKSYTYSILVMLLLCSYATVTHAQSVGVKTNLVTDAMATPTLGVEVGLKPRWTLAIDGQFKAWDSSTGKQRKHWLAQPEARYWFCDRWNGHFIGFHALGGQHNVINPNRWPNVLSSQYYKLDPPQGSDDVRLQGWFVGAGFSYGYDWILNKHWNIEATIGIGYVYSQNDKFRCAGCGKRVEEDTPVHYVGPTKAALNIIYLF